MSSVTVSKSPRPTAFIVLLFSEEQWTAELDHPPGSWILPVLAAVHVFKSVAEYFYKYKSTNPPLSKETVSLLEVRLV